jgi:nucleoside-diphosphate kinase
MPERTLVLIKPDGVARGLIGEVLSRIERKGLRIVALDLRTVDATTAGLHYEEHATRPFFTGLVEFVTSGPLVAAVVEGPDAVGQWRALMGATNPVAAAPGTIRGDLATEMSRNIAHGSDSVESAEREIKIFFPDLATSPQG